MIQHSAQRGQQPFQDHQGIHVHLHSGPNPQQEPWEIPATSHTGPPPSSFTNLAVQAFQPSNYTHFQPPTGSPHSPPTVHTGRGTYFYGKYTHLSTIHPLHPQYPHTKSTSIPTTAPSW